MIVVSDNRCFTCRQAVFKSSKHVLFWIMYNNYSMKALLNFILVVFINHQGIKK